jgi:hypothetical protein
MSIVPHKFAGVEVDQAVESFNIGKHLIPKGYVNLTQMCKAGKKKIAKFWENKRTEAYIACVSTDVRIPTSALIVEIKGGGYEIQSDMQGTWGHHLVALSLASWISPEFELLANKVLWNVINGDFQALTEAAEEQQLELQQRWQSIRNAGKVTRLKLTDAIQSWYERNPNGTTRPAHAMYAQTTDNIYKALWNKTAKQLAHLWQF